MLPQAEIIVGECESKRERFAVPEPLKHSSVRNTPSALDSVS
jgi:hypothetical protein